MYLFDLHCDTITELNKKNAALVNDSFQLSIDHLPGSAWCQCFAIFIPDTLRGSAAADYFEDNYRFFCAQIERYKDFIVQARTAGEIHSVLGGGKIAAVLTVEGGSALGGDLSRVRRLAQCGVRMITLTWNGSNEIAGGSKCDCGFTPFGEEAVAELEREQIVLDVSHLNDRSFWELARFAGRPFAASHSNSRAVCNHPRNLTDEQFRFLVQTGGLVGLNYYPLFVSGGDDASFAQLADHVEHFLSLGGENILALGSDFDGADMPSWLPTAARNSDFYALMSQTFGQTVTDKIFFQNAYDFFMRYDGFAGKAGADSYSIPGNAWAVGER